MLKILAVAAGLIATAVHFYLSYAAEGRRDPGIASTVAILVVAVLLALAKQGFTEMRRYSDRHLLAPASKQLASDPRPVILLLRTFLDDFAPLTGADEKTFEETLCRQLEKLGPVVAIGRPGESLPPLGAARFWTDDSQWQGVVEEIAREAQYVVLMMGPLPPQEDGHSGLRWEVGRAFEADLREKLILVVPPISDDALGDRWNQYRESSGNQLPEFTGGEICAVGRGPLAFELGRVKHPVKRREAWMYEECLRIAVESKPRAAWRRIRSSLTCPTTRR